MSAGWRAAVRDALFVPDEGGGLRRRPADAITVIAGVVVVAFTASRIESSTSVEITFAELLNRLPDGLSGTATFLYRLGGLWFVGLAVAASGLGGRRRLAGALAAAGGGAWVTGRVLIAIGGDRPAPSSIVIRYGHLQAYPLVRVAVSVAILTAAAPYLTVLAHRIGLSIALFLSLTAVYLGVGLPNDALAGAVIGLAIGSAVKFALGSPAGRPSLDQLRTALDELDIPRDELRFAELDGDHETTLVARDPSGDVVHIRAYGRDEREAQLLSKAWRFAWYSESGAPLVLTRLQQVEHEAYALLRARAAGVPTPDVLAAATAGAGTALLVDRRHQGDRASSLDASQLTDAVLQSIWRAAAALHRARVAHGALDLHHVIVAPDGDIELVDFRAAITSATANQLAADGARLLAATCVAVGADRAVAAAATAYDHDQLAAMLPFLQAPVLTDRVRAAFKHDRQLLTELRSKAAGAAGVEVPKPAQLARTEPRSIVLAAFTFLGVYLMLGQLASFRDLQDHLAHLHWGWIAVAVICAALTNVGYAIAYIGAAPMKLPVGSVVALQAAGSFTGLVSPAGLGTTAMNLRFLHVRGVPIGTALATSLVNSVASTVVNVALLLAVLPASGSTVDIGRIPWHGVIAVALLVIAVGALVGALLWRLPRVRHLYDEQVRPALEDIAEVTRSPSKLALVIGGNLIVAVLYGIALLSVCRAFGDGASFTTLLFVNITVSYIVGLIPVPGGLGVAETGFAAALSSVGVPATSAVGVALSYRLITSWLPPLPGWFSFRYLEREGDI